MFNKLLTNLNCRIFATNRFRRYATIYNCSLSLINTQTVIKMKLTSKTGLTASPTKKIIRHTQVSHIIFFFTLKTFTIHVFKIKTVQLKAIAKPAPFVLKPFAGLYNPYPYGCSLLCNHPTDNEAKELLKKAKNSWVRILFIDFRIVWIF